MGRESVSREPPAHEVTPAAEPRAQAPALVALQRSAGNRSVTRWLGERMNADFSDVRLCPDSDRAAGMGARAFAEGSDVHFAPGQFRPGEPDGLELIGHELAHVVQQREGRARPGDRLASGELADRSPGLEREAEQQGRRAAQGLPARPAGAFSAPGAGRAVIQGAFTASAELTPATGEEEEVAPGAISLSEILVSDQKRPPTRIEGSQGRHTVAWQAKVRFWKAHFSNITFATALDRLHALAEGDETVDSGAGDAGAAGTEARAALREELAALRGPDAVRSPSEWVRVLEWGLTTYAKAYQRSAFAAFPSLNPKGRNEAGHLALLADANARVAKGEAPVHKVQVDKGGKKVLQDMTPAEVLARARGLLDLSPQAPAPLLHKAFTDWLKVIRTLYPDLFTGDVLRAPTDDEAATILTGGYQRVLALFAYMAGTSTAPPVAGDDEVAAVAEDDVEEVEDEEQAQAGATALLDTEPFLIRVDSKQTGGTAARYRAAELRVKGLIVSDERPNTQFGAKQMSHTIPWTLSRTAWLREFGGYKTLVQVVGQMNERLQADSAWSVPSTWNWVIEVRDDLAAKLARVDDHELPIPDWSAWLASAVESYVSCYEAAPFATFATEPGRSGDSAARGRGEASAMLRMHEWEGELIDQVPPPADDEVAQVAKKLVEVPGLNTNRASVDIDKLKLRWLADMRAVFPMLVQRCPQGFEDAWREAAVQDDHAMHLNDLMAQTGRQLRERKRKAD